VWSKFQVDWPEMGIGRLDEILSKRSLITGAVIFDGVLFDPEEADGISKQKIALTVVREMAGRDDFKAGGGPDGRTVWDEIWSRRCLAAVCRLYRNGQHPTHAGAGSVQEKILAPVVKGDAPRVRDAELGGALELGALRAEAVKSAVDAAD